MELSNSYFKAELPAHEIENKSLDDIAEQFNIKVYNYMADNYGLIDNASDLDNSLKEKYTDYNKHKLKKCLRLLKTNEPENLNEIRFVSKLLRSKIQTEQSSVTTTSANINHNELIKADFWKYVKRFIEKPKKILPTFNQIVCTEYFRKTLQSINPTKRFTIPSWLPALKPQHTSMTSPLPRIKRSQKIIRRMKASGSPCPLDQISIIVFKRCPYLRSYLQLVFRKISCTGQIPSMWKKAVTILIYKKGEQNDAQNFRPITLETVPLKIYTSFLRNRMYNFLISNLLFKRVLLRAWLELSNTLITWHI